MQADLKRLGHPWALSKAFHGSCPLGNVFSLEGIDLQNLELSLEVGSVNVKPGVSLMS